MTLGDRIFNPENKFFTFMGKVADLMALNLIFLITSLPVITLGASLTALSSVTLSMAKKRETYIFKMYWKIWKANLKRSTLLFLIAAALGAFLLTDLWVTGGPLAEGFPFAKYLRYLFLVLSFLWLCAFLYLFPLQATFENSPGATLKNALLTAISRFPYTLAMILILAAPFVLVWYLPLALPYAAFFFLLMGFAVISRVHAFFLLKAFRPFLPEEPEEDADCEQL